MNPHNRRLFWLRSLLCASVTMACARESKEPPRAVHDSQAIPSPVAQAPMQPSPPANALESAPPPSEPGADDGISKDKKSSSGAPRRAQGAPSMAPKPAAPKAAARESADESSPANGSAEPSPTLVESDELRRLLREFDTQAEQLANSHGCEDACRAYDSMRRSAQRICDLVLSDDPRARCRVAKSRVTDASRDLASRCGDCR
jgi:hypothetical protein